MSKLCRFPGGVHPLYDGKDLSAGEAVRCPPLLPAYIVPLQQHLGQPGEWVVKKGDTVKKGQLLAKATGLLCVPLHAPTSGEIAAITTCPGPAGTHVPAVELRGDGRDEAAATLEPIPAWESAAPETLRDRVRDAGIVGMGGASFPTHVKLSPPPNKRIDTIILNGVECEPFLTADDRLEIEATDAVLTGARIFQRILGAARVVVAIEHNKPDSIRAMRDRAAAFGVEVATLPVRYPQGAEKQLIYAVAGRKVPAGALPMEVGCLVQNVGTAAATAAAVLQGQPLIDRVTTITGRPVANPGNWRLRIGTPLKDALAFAGGVTGEVAKILFGGPMMGMAQSSLDVPVLKNTSGILLLGPGEVSPYTSGPCIRCGACADACPMRLNPSDLGIYIENERFAEAEAASAMDCIECGACAFACPTRRPLVQHLRRAKAEIAANRRAAAAAAAAKK
ncbi:MAG: electron transport complex subunit RsxC [Lentisphaeria bacterium]|jgi:electron transport complex protein RnfC